MKPSDQKRFIYINFMMSQINDRVDEIYEALADNDQEEAAESAEMLKTMCNEIISDAAIQAETK
jgi:uncharacterized protein (UPF0305 family)